MAYTGLPLPPPTVLTALATGVPPDDLTRIIPPKDQPFAATAYSLDLFDDGMFKRSTSNTPVTVTIPKNIDIPIPVDSTIHFMQGGTGNVTFTAASGVALNSKGGAVSTTQQWGVVHLWQYDIDKWLLYSDGAGGGGGGGSPPAPPNTSVQYNNSGAFGGSANWLFDPDNSAFTLGTDTVYQREAAHTVAIRSPLIDVPLDLNIYGRFSPLAPSTDFDRMKLGAWQLETNDDFYMGITLESEWDLDGFLVLQPCGDGGIVAQLPSPGGGSSWRLNPRGANSIDLQINSGNEVWVAGADYSAIIGGQQHEITVDADFSGIFVGQGNTIDSTAITGTGSAYDSAIAGGQYNYISGDSSFIGGGGTNSCIGTYCAIVGGYINRIADRSNFNHTPVSANHSIIVGGSENTLNADNAIILAGYKNFVDSKCSVAMGNSAHTRGVQNCLAQGAGKVQAGSGVYWPGQLQSVSYVIQVRTTDATANVVMTTDGNAVLATNSLLVQRDSAYTFHAKVVAKRFGAVEGAAFEVTGLVARSGAGTITLIGAPTVTLVARTNAAWNVAVGVNAALDSLEFKVTGTAATELWWCAQVRTAEAFTDISIPS